MTVKEFVTPFAGDFKFNVDKIDTATGNVTDVIEFANSECDAIKDSVLNGIVNKVTIKIVGGNPVVNIVMQEAAVEEPEEETPAPDDTAEPTDPVDPDPAP